MTVQYNAIPVKLPQYDTKLYLVVVKGVRGKTYDAFNKLSCEYTQQREHMEDSGILSCPLEVR